MATVETQTSATPERVFEILSRPELYEDWVVASADLRAAEDEWPAVGATFHHTQFVPKVGLKDTTSVLDSDPPRYLCLCVRARPLVVAKVELFMHPHGGGTRIEMIEVPVGGLVGKLNNPAVELSLKLRNTESLRRLKKLAEAG